MPIYSYRAVQGGRTTRGEIAAENERQARALIRESGATPVSIAAKTSERARPPDLAWLAAFTRQLGTLLKAGFPLDRALTTLAGSAPDPRARTVLAALDDGVRRGQRFSDAAARAFSTASMGGVGAASELVAILEAGEAAGDLAPVLLNYAEMLDRRLVFRRRLRGALFYPLIVAGMAVLVVAFLFVYVVPTITRLFEGTNLPLPLPTRILIVVANAVQAGWMPGIAVLLVAAWFLKRWMATAQGRLSVEARLQSLPVIGSILAQAAGARWLRTFGTLLGNGVEILSALDIAGRTAASPRLQKAVARARPRVAEGVPLAKALAETGAFPAVAVEAVTLGESSGTLPHLLLELAAAWEGEVETSAERFADLLEPLVLVVMGVLVGGIVLAVLLPIFEFNASVR